MRVIVVVIATLATVGLAVLGMFTARTLSSPTDHVVRVKSAPEAQGSGGATRFSNPVAPPHRCPPRQAQRLLLSRRSA